MKVEIKLITPESAAKLLQRNTKNRSVKPNKIRTYVRDMKEDKWMETGAPIRISKTNKLLDGQHRLMAVVESGVSVEMVVVSDIDDKVMANIDTGTKRSPGDVFKIEGISYASATSAIIKKYIRLLFDDKTNTGNTEITNQDLLDTYNENPEYWQDIVQKSHVWYNSSLRTITPGFIGGIYAILHDIHPVDAKDFCDQITGVKPAKYQVISLLKNKLIEDKMRKPGLPKMPESLKTIYVYKTWNYYRSDTDVTVLKYYPNSDRNIKPI